MGALVLGGAWPGKLTTTLPFTCLTSGQTSVHRSCTDLPRPKEIRTCYALHTSTSAIPVHIIYPHSLAPTTAIDELDGNGVLVLGTRPSP